MERLLNEPGKTPCKTAFPVNGRDGLKPLRDKALGCIAQLVEQLTLNQLLSPTIQSLSCKRDALRASTTPYAAWAM